MSTEIESQVRDAMEHRTGEVVPPRVDVEALVRRGQRQRGLRAVCASALAIVVIGGGAYAVGAATDTGGDGSRPARDGGLPVATGGAKGPSPVEGPTEVFHTKKSVSIDGVSHPVGNFTWDTGGHIGREGIAYPDQKTGTPYLMKRDGTQVALAPAQPKFGEEYAPWVAADAASPLVAWVEVGPKGVDLVAYDSDKMTEIARRGVTCDDTDMNMACAVPYVASDDVVFVHMPDGGTVGWRPADGTWVELGAGTVSQAHGKVVGLFPGEKDLDLSPLGEGWSNLEVSGPFWEEQEKYGDVDPLLSFDGSWVTDTEGKRIEDWRMPKATVTLDPPGREVAAQYDTDGSVMFVTFKADKASDEGMVVPEEAGTFRVWDCTATAACTPLTEPTKQEIRLLSTDL